MRKKKKKRRLGGGGGARFEEIEIGRKLRFLRKGMQDTWRGWDGGEVWVVVREITPLVVFSRGCSHLLCRFSLTLIIITTVIPHLYLCISTIGHIVFNVDSKLSLSLSSLLIIYYSHTSLFATWSSWFQLFSFSQGSIYLLGEHIPRSQYVYN